MENHVEFIAYFLLAILADLVDDFFVLGIVNGMASTKSFLDTTFKNLSNFCDFKLRTIFFFNFNRTQLNSFKNNK